MGNWFLNQMILLGVRRGGAENDLRGRQREIHLSKPKKAPTDTMGGRFPGPLAEAVARRLTSLIKRPTGPRRPALILINRSPIDLVCRGLRNSHHYKKSAAGIAATAFSRTIPSLRMEGVVCVSKEDGGAE